MIIIITITIIIIIIIIINHSYNNGAPFWCDWAAEQALQAAATRLAGRVADGFITTSGKAPELYSDTLLPALAEGSAIGAWALMEPDSIALGSMQATAKADGEGYLLHGTKAWVSNAGIAGLYVIFAVAPAGPALICFFWFI